MDTVFIKFNVILIATIITFINSFRKKRFGTKNLIIKIIVIITATYTCLYTLSLIGN